MSLAWTVMVFYITVPKKEKASTILLVPHVSPPGYLAQSAVTEYMETVSFSSSPQELGDSFYRIVRGVESGKIRAKQMSTEKCWLGVLGDVSPRVFTKNTQAIEIEGDTSALEFTVRRLITERVSFGRNPAPHLNCKILRTASSKDVGECIQEMISRYV